MGSKTARNALFIGITLRPTPGARCTIEIDSFVPGAEIDRRFFDAPYYVTPNDPVGQEAFGVIREAMRSKALVALGRIVLTKRERVIALEPKKLVLIPGGHFDPYRDQFPAAEAAATEWFCEHLVGSDARPVCLPHSAGRS
jgi:hypothetical protein